MSTKTRIRIVIYRSGWLLIAVLIPCCIRDLGMWDGVAAALLAIFSLGIHELGHIFAALAAGVPVHEAGLKFIGAYTRRKPAASRLQEIGISAAGPFASTLLFFIMFFVPRIGPWLSAWNLGVLVLNLVPYPGTDGHRILKTIFARSPQEIRPFRIGQGVPSKMRGAELASDLPPAQ